MRSVYTSGFAFIFILQQVQNLQGNVVLCKLFLSCLQRDPHLRTETGAGLIGTGVKGEKILGGKCGGGRSPCEQSPGCSSCLPV